jgi:hypothetical protein
MMNYKVRRLRYRDGTPRYQLGRYIMRGAPGKRRSHFQVLVDLGHCASPEEALEAWPRELSRLGHKGHFRSAARLSAKLSKLLRLMVEQGHIPEPKRRRRAPLLVEAFEEMMDASRT